MLRLATSILAAGAITALFALAACLPEGTSKAAWTPEELKRISSLSLAQLPALPPDPSNRVADDPQAAALGEALFKDTRLSSNGQVSCATCHLSKRQFQDDVPLAKGVGTTNRRTMPIVGTAYSPWLFWDGRKDSQWSQALGPLESPVEHGADRTQIARLIGEHYRDAYELIFGNLPDLDALPQHAAPAGSFEVTAAWKRLDESGQDAINRVFANVGKAIAAFERTLLPRPTRFDRYAEVVAKGEASAKASLLSAQELQGLRLFVGKASCINCHNGPLLTDNHFHNTGIPAVPALPEDLGRSLAVEQVRSDPFNCLGRYSDAGPDHCAELKYMATEGEELIRAYKSPSLRGVADRPPFMHAGQIGTLAEVLVHYNSASNAPAGHSELKALELSSQELAALEAFLGTLSEEPEDLPGQLAGREDG
jgi:cytochrome c peroxidase